VPKIAPLAPTEGTPTKEKFPPRTFLKRSISKKPIERDNNRSTYPKIPAAKYRKKNLSEPISRST
jgi:hypothetical protein